MIIEVNTGDVPDVQTVEIYADGVSIGWAGTPDFFGEWGFPGDAHLSVMRNDWGAPGDPTVILDYHPDADSPMVFFDGEFVTPTQFSGGYSINTWPNPPTGNATIDFTRVNGKINVVITGDGALGVREHTGGVLQYYDGNYSFTWDAPPAGIQRLSAKVTFINPTTLEEDVYSTSVVSVTVNAPAAPEIAVMQPASTELLSGQSTVAMPPVVLGRQSSATVFTIRNTGNAILKNLAVSRAGSHPNDFVVTGPPVSQLAPGGSTTFSVVFKPLVQGARRAQVRVASNDADENPFVIGLTGNATREPEIVVEQPAGNSLVSGQSKVTLPPSVLNVKSKPAVFTVRNVGNAVLSGIYPSLVGEHADDFILVRSLTNQLNPGAKTTFSVVFKPKAKGVRKATLRVSSNDADESPFVIALVGNASTAPEIDVRKFGSSLKDNKSGTGFGRVWKRSKSDAVTFTIRNVGSAPLKNLKVVVKGSHPMDFVVTQPGKSSLAPKSETKFKVFFAPKKIGDRKAVLQIISNDADENPFRVKLEGKGIIGGLISKT
jgi:hypothetical protein